MNKATRDQENKPLETNPVFELKNVELVEDTQENPRVTKTKRIREEETNTRTQFNNGEEEEEDDDDNFEGDLNNLSWPELFAWQLLSQVNDQDKLIDQDTPLLSNPLHKDSLLERIDTKYFGRETTHIGASHRRPIGKPWTYGLFGATPLAKMQRALAGVPPLENNKGQPTSKPQYSNAPRPSGGLTPQSEPGSAPPVEHTLKCHTNSQKKIVLSFEMPGYDMDARLALPIPVEDSLEVSSGEEEQCVGGDNAPDLQQSFRLRG
ncbi:hypothetical protein RIF29_25040 [Crotalaria pallida]|uniref:Uncharacterized protein n=1 Tax=Crotalaria pallida TaxID=3830 RepID=A0AAN9HX46_CROPI